jgi:hypothetical protein
MTNSSAAATATSTGFVDFVVGELNCARLDRLIEANEIETTIAGLKAGLIGIEAAVAHLDQLGLVPVAASSSEAEAA